MGTFPIPNPKDSLYFYPEAIDFHPLTEGFFGKCPNNRNCSRVEGESPADPPHTSQICTSSSVSHFKWNISFAFYNVAVSRWWLYSVLPNCKPIAKRNFTLSVCLFISYTLWCLPFLICFSSHYCLIYWCFTIYPNFRLKRLSKITISLICN